MEGCVFGNKESGVYDAVLLFHASCFFFFFLLQSSSALIPPRSCWLSIFLAALQLCLVFEVEQWTRKTFIFAAVFSYFSPSVARERAGPRVSTSMISENAVELFFL
jgi:hypothetical protein